MGKTEHQKELLAEYKERKIVGGVCAVRCGVSGKCLLLPAVDPEGQRNRFAFAQATDTPLHPLTASDWQAHGAASFTFEVLETLEKGPAQTDKAFRTELEELAGLWRERLTGEGAAFY